jgi:hypothetical protein
LTDQPSVPELPGRPVIFFDTVPIRLRRQGSKCEYRKLADEINCDFVFSCPPYWNLERYSDDAADLSNMSFDEFLVAYRAIIAGAVGRFAVWVIGDVRDEQGCYINLPGRTVDAFEAAGARLYNEAILVTAVGSLPIRAGRQFATSRKLGRTPQSALIFVKDDPRRATEACGPVEFGEIPAALDGGAHRQRPRLRSPSGFLGTLCSCWRGGGAALETWRVHHIGKK